MPDFFKLPNISSIDIANATKNIIVREISIRTGLMASVADAHISVSGTGKSAQVLLKSSGIPIHNYQPSYDQSGPSRARIRADISMVKGQQLISKAFRNPVAGINARRKTKSAYPIIPVYGPSVAQLFLGDKQHILSQVDAQIGATLNNG
jgi:hypothetical protein